MTELEILDGYFRAANYLSAGELYLLDNPDSVVYTDVSL